MRPVALDPLQNHYLLHAAKADIHKRNGELNHAQTAFEQALRLAVSPMDKKFLKRRILQCRLRVN
jgi:RNA polymerase sigma-70 factor (ECF subfamily)